MIRVLKSKQIFDGQNLLENSAIIVDNKKIIKVISTQELSTMTDVKVDDYDSKIISPGFIDLQLNGCGGVLFNDDISTQTLEIMYQTCLKYGTTSFLPTLISCDFVDVVRALDVTKTWFNNYGAKRGVIGIHLEGPFISAFKRGIHEEHFIIPPTDELLNKIISYRQFFPIKLTIAPEVFTESQIKLLVEADIILSLGHSNADYITAKQAFGFGVKTATHTFNTMSGLTGRNPGVIGAVFLDIDSYCGVIVDGLHVDYANVGLLCKLKPEHVYLVTDAVTPMGTTITEFVLAGKTLHIKDGRCLDDNGTLGGAYLTMPEALANSIKYANIKLVDAFKMVNRIPAIVMGYENSLGRIAPGYVANLIAVDPKTFKCQVINGI